MEPASVECTHCRVVMTSWSAPGSTIRYYQCPFCARTHSSLYGEVFRRHAGARVVDAPAAPSPVSAIPMATPEDARWARVKQTAARWFARLEDDQRDCADRGAPLPARASRAVSARRGDGVPKRDSADVVEVAPARVRKR
jgi:hypothetical protein